MVDLAFVFKIKADFLRALAHPVRLKIIEHLKNREQSVGKMVKSLEVEQSSLSKHLAILKQAGILSSRQVKVTVYYSIRDRGIFDVLRPTSLFLRKRLKESQDVLAHLGEG
ncbi:MAG TPA: metalloregulator ArsR/SmtB family transcription factor [bacterium]|nr:metalloregulator ArsR/SmtB family transcription factor [bacterium]